MGASDGTQVVEEGPVKVRCLVSNTALKDGCQTRLSNTAVKHGGCQTRHAGRRGLGLEGAVRWDIAGQRQGIAEVTGLGRSGRGL